MDELFRENPDKAALWHVIQSADCLRRCGLQLFGLSNALLSSTTRLTLISVYALRSTAINVISRFEFTLPHDSSQTAVDKRLALPTASDDSSVAERPGTAARCAGDASADKKAVSECTRKGVGDTGRSSPAASTSEDQSPPRRTRPREVIFIEHHMATRLDYVGLQVCFTRSLAVFSLALELRDVEVIERVTRLRLASIVIVWPAALLMADFLIDNGARWRTCSMLELGGGVGLCGIVAAMFARQTTCTDYLLEIVETMRANFCRNSSLLRGDYECCLLDVRLTSANETSPSAIPGTPYAAPACDVIFASDVIYSGEITEALMAFVKRLLQRTEDAAKEFYLALERRLNFTTEALAISCPAYEHFLEVCQQLELSRELLDISQLPEYFEYERSKYLELHRITLGPVSKGPA
ncbi:methyltransferase protein 22-like [Tropilaelaps mercedesae]|uniref:Methyltransferase protein 22-like n=1 Tax=Tropilaelaps mercedesae TaxID=418985 RepID=A0A1V9XF61_9ACAR|nr:methyltransferase protein 22-like [Tropilaelaps mercedesae]